ncbi:hypothetical protein KJ359_003503 [Pestalotiopsis sp. 9143b]|nr:hypothetical protein KJ359_003503 [Pestalotiopsis sp. 9143b]
MSPPNMSAESQNTGAGQEDLPSQPAQNSRKRTYSNMSAEHRNTVPAELAGLPSRLAYFSPASTQPSQAPPGTVRQRDWASGEAKEFAARQDLIVSDDWEAVAHQEMVHLLDLANDAWDEKDPATRQKRIKAVLEMQRSHCNRLVPLIYSNLDRLSNFLLSVLEENNPADEALIEVIRDLLENHQLAIDELKRLQANEELSWDGFYEAHRLVIRANMLLGTVRQGFAEQEKLDRRNGLRNGQPSEQLREQRPQQQSSSQQDGTQNDHHPDSSGSPIVQQSVQQDGQQS